jgi:hypothetical protein
MTELYEVVRLRSIQAKVGRDRPVKGRGFAQRQNSTVACYPVFAIIGVIL